MQNDVRKLVDLLRNVHIKGWSMDTRIQMTTEEHQALDSAAKILEGIVNILLHVLHLSITISLNKGFVSGRSIIEMRQITWRPVNE